MLNADKVVKFLSRERKKMLVERMSVETTLVNTRLVKTTLAEFMLVGNYLYKVPNGEKSACRNGFASNSSKRDLTLK